LNKVSNKQLCLATHNCVDNTLLNIGNHKYNYLFMFNIYIKIYCFLVFVIIFIFYLSLIVQHARVKFQSCVGMQYEDDCQFETWKIINK